ncbi:hypothetical protein [Allokutzneria albata]|uniref:Uncharacterized protein n=1 Tax=Allokutzneria albata TaxID=211114 RepID=A0A1G9Z146_ALLAB|nr:hypothetical protein [Allokutzneria albata]SDN15102.1 hypothetical protein SAMN04489726_5199 [Allokutzneria albata]
MKTRTLSAALVLCAAAIGLTGTAHATQADRAAAARIDLVNCLDGNDFLEITVTQKRTFCFANAGVVDVSIPDV